MNGFALEILKKNKDRINCVALVDQNGTREITWDSLRDKICRVAAFARRMEIHGIVPVCMDRGMEVTATILGLNLAGIGVAPLSVTTPEARCENISEQLGNTLWTEETFHRACEVSPEYDMIAEGKEAEQAYVVFTSGSTGRPKGVMMDNEGILAFIRRTGAPKCFDFREGDRILQTTSLSFVAFAMDLFAPLYAGVLVYILPEESRGDPHIIADFVNRYGITGIHMPPQLYRNFEVGPSLRCILTGSDRIVNIGPRGCRLVGLYGLTESVGPVFYYDIKEPMSVTPIGFPGMGISAHVLDENGNEAEEGELCLCGPVALGYLGMEELSRKVFTSNPFSDDPAHSRLVHTGDIVRRDPDGCYFYINRKDNMFKINGQRVEPGEIEACLMTFPEITAAVVKGFSDDNRHSFVCAFYTSLEETDEDKMRAFLASKLPHYMVPSVFVKLDQMPLNSNGKLDRRALEKPDLSAFANRYEAPVGEAEEALCRAFQTVLDIPKAGRNDDFFRLGGDSISVLSVISECGHLGISAGDIFAGRTPKAIAALSKQNNGQIYANLPVGLKKAQLTESQMGILLECGLGEKCAKYNIPMKITFPRTSGMTVQTVKAAVDTVIAAHPALYAQIAEENGTFFMVRNDFLQDGICTVREITDEAVIGEREEKIAAPVALGCDPLCQAEAYLTLDKVILLLNMHHIVSDGTSAALIASQIGDALKGQKPAAETVDAFSLYDAECRIKKSGAYSSAKTYFAALLGGTETDSSLIPDHKDSEKGRAAEEVETFRLPKMEIQAFLENTDFTESTFFMGVYGYVLAKMTGQKESLFAVAESGRETALKDTVSMMVKTIPVIVSLNEEESGRELMAKLQAQFFASLRNDSVGFEELAREYGIRSDVMFVYQSDLLNGFEMLPAGEALSSLSLMVLKRDDAYELRISYRKDLYEKYTIERFANLYKRAAEAFIGGRPMKETELISAADRAFLDEENDASRMNVPEETLVQIFRKTALRLPDKTAIMADGRAFTYHEVDEVSDKIASYLVRQGIGRGDVVSVLIPRCEYMLIAGMGVLKSGAAYQPLDPSYPEERLAFMTQDAGAVLIIKDRRYDHMLTGFQGKILYTDEIADLPAGDILLPEPSMEDLFILLYTSGTTGTPKGVMLTHRNLSAFVYADAKVRGLEESSVVSQYASFGFDAHMHEIYPSVLMGCTIMIIPEEIRLDLKEIKTFCEASHITHLFMTTQVARQFAVAYPQVKGLQVLDTGGEKLVSFDPAGHNYRIKNLYGPTEGTVASTQFMVDRMYENIPIGRAMPGYRLYVADSFGRRVPVGVPGELIQCGPQVGAGYLNRPDLTEKVFVENTFEDAGSNYRKCYKTGDIVRYIQDGNIEYIGRRDHQVKIRGFRIELGEVEKAIRDYRPVKDAAVTAVDNGGGKSICAYVVSDEKINIAELNRFIAMSHPAYMVPAVTMQIDKIPLNANGKVDRRKLPAPVMHFENVKKPENELQQQIFDSLSEILGTDEFGIDTDIFDAGLSSIGSIRLCTMLDDKWNMPVKIRDLKRCRTVAGLESFIRTEKNPDKPEETGIKSAMTAQEYGPSHPITKTMEGIFTECLSRPDSTVYNIPYLMKLGSGIDENRLKEAIVAAVEAHPCMKAELFTDEEGNVCQHRRLYDSYTADEIVVRNPKDPGVIGDALVTPFKLTGSRLFEISLIRADGLYLFVNIHHIIIDGTSMMIFLKDIEKAYMGEKLTEEKYSAFDVAQEEKKARTEEELNSEKEYYEALLDGIDKDFLPASDRLPDMPEGTGTLSMSSEEADAIAIREYCAKHRIGLNAYFVSVFGTVLARYAGTDYSVFNTVYNGRNDSRLGNTVAMLVKTLPVVCRTEVETTEELLQEMSAQLMDSMANDVYSYAEISRRFGVRNDVMFIFQGDSFENSRFCGEETEEVALKLGEAKAPLALQAIIRSGKLVYELEYDPKLFTEAMAMAFVQAYDRAAASFMQEEKLGRVSLLSSLAEAEMEKHNDTEADYDRSRTINDFFTEKAGIYPDKLCVSYENRNYSYAQVDELTARLAGFLMKQGIGRGNIVAILINRDENMVIGAHGVIRAGAAYLGLDPSYPSERLEFMIKDSGASCLIADRSLLSLLPDYKGNVIFTDEIAGLTLLPAEEFHHLADSPKHRATPEDQAIVIYSSGTTGLPKGSVLRHRNIVCFYHNYTGDYQIDTASRVATYASFGFDGGAMDVFCVPMAGASLYVVPDEIRLDLGRLEQFYIENNITNGFMTTQVGCMFIAATKCRSLRYFLVGGETLIPVTAPDWVVFTNGYGPSETMCYVNKYRVLHKGSLQPIGKVAHNTKEYIIDRFGNRLPYGACGELCISGGQVGSGYLNRPEKTAEVFVRNPFCDDPEYEVMYRTGDVVRMLPDGNYDFVGRRDGQVKIRGFRVELSEIEHQILKYPGVVNAVVKAWDNPSGVKYLAAYVVMTEKMDTDALKNFIATEKPDYMVPAVIMQLEEIPLTSNGKTDGGKLPKPELGSVKKGAEPANETEEKLCAIFAEVTGVEKVYADDDFFRIGGTSISAIQAVVKCEQAGFAVVYKNLFANPTPQKLAQFLAGTTTGNDTADDTDKEGKFDYSALEYNIISNLPQIRHEGVGDVLLTGATGFLGCHIFRELMDSASGRVICLVRSKNGQTAENRLRAMMTYYFEDWYTEEKILRTTVIDGDLEEENIREKLNQVHFDTIINCAANVKHFASGNELLTANYSGAEHLIGLAQSSGAKLIQISTISVSGESVNGSVPDDVIFKEFDLNIGQSLENRYIYSKYLAEQAVIDAISKKKIRGKIIRLGNLMARIDDSQFQVNAIQNGMLRTYLGFVRLGCFPINMMDRELEFSPIDMVAKAVVLLAGTPDDFTVFHARNCNSIHYGYLLQAITEAGYPVEIVEDNVFEERLRKALSSRDDVTELGGLLAYRNNTGTDEKRVPVPVSTTFTTKALYRLGFAWPLVSMDYLREMVRMLDEFYFFGE